MSNSYFQFKKFVIRQSHCAMKVGTDGVLLGAWTPVDGTQHILDVGTGTGVVALMLAQRTTNAKIIGIEIDSHAASQAQDNVELSLWNKRIKIECANFLDYQTELRFDLIVSNPPYFTNALKCIDTQRNLARHDEGLNYQLLFQHASQLLTTNGHFSVIVPTLFETQVTDIAWYTGLYPVLRTHVFTKPSKPARRTLIYFARHLQQCLENDLYIEDEKHNYSSEYIALTRDFYLKF